ncbi:hypothetical protein LJC63_00715 [Ruminococcaceae bacterium OttesenSCG-928-L11]|nr:hypothetical protein [Ruminococcaceae bacterium OttesenSCG-928-L11]
MAATGGKLEKAVIFINNNGSKSKVAVQFNPTEYKITNIVRLAENRALGGDADIEETQAVYGLPSILRLNLYFDSYTPMAGVDLAKNQQFKMDRVKSLKNSKDQNAMAQRGDERDPPDPDESVNVACDNFVSLIRYDPQVHQPPDLAFVWGDYLEFVGKMEACTVKYTMFSRSGIPVRAKMDLIIKGEDRSKLQKGKQNPFESPDRTKERLLADSDQLWMLAGEEYGDPAQWKVIAQANGILNPRSIKGAVRLKVPSIR